MPKDRPYPMPVNDISPESYVLMAKIALISIGRDYLQPRMLKADGRLRGSWPSSDKDSAYPSSERLYC